MQHQLDRIELQLNRIDGQLDKIDDQLIIIDQKLDNHIERIAKVEASGGWVKWTLAFVISAIGSIVVAMAKLKI